VKRSYYHSPFSYSYISENLSVNAPQRHSSTIPALHGISSSNSVKKDTETLSMMSRDYVASAIEQASVWNTQLRVPSSGTKRMTKTSATRAKTTNMSFTTVYASRSRFTAIPATALSISQTMSIDQTSSPTYELRSRARFQRTVPTPAVVVGSGSLGEGPISTTSFYFLVVGLVVALMFSLRFFLVVIYPKISLKTGFRIWMKYWKHSGNKKNSMPGNKGNNSKSTPVIQQSTFSKSSYLERQHTRK
jgi:hypothetical protein